jgi:hypothetical protein
MASFQHNGNPFRQAIAPGNPPGIISNLGMQIALPIIIRNMNLRQAMAKTALRVLPNI